MITFTYILVAAFIILLLMIAGYFLKFGFNTKRRERKLRESKLQREMESIKDDIESSSNN